jgi:hypothetical protein
MTGRRVLDIVTAFVKLVLITIAALAVAEGVQAAGVYVTAVAYGIAVWCGLVALALR